MSSQNEQRAIKEGFSYLRGNKTNVTPVTISQNGKPQPKPIKIKENEK